MDTDNSAEVKAWPEKEAGVGGGRQRGKKEGTSVYFEQKKIN